MKEKIKQILCKVNSKVETYEGENLVKDMEIDSHDIFNIVVDLEETFEMEISPIYLKVSNFNSVERIERMIREIKGC